MAELIKYLGEVRGPEFLVVYAVMFVIFFAPVLVIRKVWQDHWVVTTAGLVAFEGLGVARIYFAAQQGKHRIGFLLIMMLLGGIIFLLRAKETGEGYGICGSCGGFTSCGGG